jgi:peptide/nickel transport system ATP-binding protein
MESLRERQGMQNSDAGQKELVLRVTDLRAGFPSSRGLARVLDGVSFELHRREILALVGETGCGKSVTAKTMLDLIPQARPHRSGRVEFGGRNLLELSSDELQQVRGKRIAMVFQNPQASINPVFTLGEQIFRLIRMYLPDEIRRLQQEQSYSAADAARRIAEERLQEVGLPEPDRMLKLYCFEISGGMAQRYKIAQALISSPDLLIADEATSALDVTVQAHILKLLKGLCRRRGTAIMFITHDLGIAAQICDRIAVMYAGRIVEVGETREMFASPLHPYTRGLLGSAPRLGAERKLAGIPGVIPDLCNPPAGCRFHPRCEAAMDRCRQEVPPCHSEGGGHVVACHLYPPNMSAEGQRTA